MASFDKSLVRDGFEAFPVFGEEFVSSENNQEDSSNVMPVYQIKQTPPDLGETKLQDVYGTGAMPMWEFVRKIQTGEATFDPENQFHQSAAEYLADASDEEFISRGYDPGIKGEIAQLAGGITQAAIGQAGAQMAAEGLQTGLGSIKEAFRPEILTRTFTEGFPGLLPSRPNVQLGPAAKTLEGATQVGASLPANHSLISPATYRDLGGLQTFGPVNMAGANVVVPTNSLKLANITANKNPMSSSIVSRAPDPPGMFSTEPGGGLAPYTPGIGQVGLNFGIAFGVNMAMGMKPKKAAKGAAASAAGGAVGAFAGGPIGAMVGSTIGGMVGGRVICNELCRQGYLTRKEVILDYAYTRDYFTPIHVNGYHFWALGVVRSLRKNKRVKFWRHLAKHRANYVSYVYGKRDKQDYLGKFYNFVGANACYFIGLFCKRTDWSVLYKPKEI